MLIVLCIFTFIRPFISSLVSPSLNLIYTLTLICFLVIWIIKKRRLQEIQTIGTLKLPLIAFCMALVISTLFSTNKINSLYTLCNYLAGMLLMLTVASLNARHKTYLIKVLIYSGLIISLLAINQYFFSLADTLKYCSTHNIVNQFKIDYLTQKRAFYPFVTPNMLGGYFSMLIPLCFISQGLTWLALVLLFGLLLTKSLGAFLSLFLGVIIFSSLQGRIRKRLILFLLSLLLVMGMVFILRSSTQKQHMQPNFSTSMRFNYWHDTLKIIKSNFWTGKGIGNFNLAQTRYSHNSYLQIWAETGILGIIAFLWLILEFFKAGLAALKKEVNKDRILIAAISSSAIFLIHNFIDFTFFTPEISLLWWAVLGLFYLRQTTPGLQRLYQ